MAGKKQSFSFGPAIFIDRRLIHCAKSLDPDRPDVKRAAKKKRGAEALRYVLSCLPATNGRFLTFDMDTLICPE
jgi:hypothetical protein